MVYLLFFLQTLFPVGITWVLVYRTEKYKRLKAEVEKQSKKRKWSLLFHIKQLFFVFLAIVYLRHPIVISVSFYFITVEKKKETITESAGRQQKKKIGKNQ